jgi:poly(3-hydroxybutyrate) depolymerase
VRTETPGQYVRFTLTVACAPADARDRLYYVRLPPNYDPNRPYRVVYLGQGCNPPQDLLSTRSVYPMETVSDPDAILVEMQQGFYNRAEYNNGNCTDTPSNNLCHYCFDDGAATTAPDSREYGYFDLLHKAIENDFCVDTDRQFYAGYSSGGWMAHQMGCQFPDVLRAQGSVTGGLPPAINSCAKECVDHKIAGFFIHDAMDSANVYAGSVQALERLLELNGCKGGRTMATAPTEPYSITGVPNDANFSCVRYTGCPVDYPIVFCTSLGKQHEPQTGAAVPGFWEFFKAL